jgi:hypothetical protein
MKNPIWSKLLGLFSIFYCLFVWWSKRHFQQYFSYIVAVSLIGGGNRRTAGENHRPVASHWQINVVPLYLIEIRTHNIYGDMHWLHM